ncbi:MAG: monovalent cation/H+ antiporter subunit D family protein [Candidatus Thermoplasmatota archaeon]|nr:monovalent cation/H+ antiporter subunit D family protein [Candidatus Thermoplasmatota archaeon]
MIPLLVALPMLFAFLSSVISYIDIDRIYRETVFLLGILSPLPVFLYNIDSLPINTVVGGWSRISGIEVGIDGVNFFFLLATLIVFPLVAVYTLSHFERIGKEEGGVSRNSKFCLILLLYGSLLGSFITRDLFNFTIYLEIASIAAIILVGSSDTSGAKLASFRYLMLYLLSSFFFIFSVGIIYVKTGYLNFPLIGQNLVLDTEMKVALSIAFVALITKAGIFPLHFWLPDAHSKADTPVSALLSGLTVKAPVFGMILFLRYTPIGFLTVPLMVISFSSIFFGIFMAIFQTNAKKLLAYHTVSQMGIVLLAISVLDIYAAAHYVFAHALFKSGLFLGVGPLISSFGTKDLKSLSYRASGSLIVSFAILSLAIGGISPLIGAFGKHEILTELRGAKVYLLYATSIGTLLSFSKLNFELFKSKKNGYNGKDQGIEKGIVFLIALLTISFGIYYYPELNPMDLVFIGVALGLLSILKLSHILEWNVPRFYGKNVEGLTKQINFYTAVFVIVNSVLILLVRFGDTLQELLISIVV